MSICDIFVTMKIKGLYNIYNNYFRVSVDSVINDNGKLLINLCKSNGLYIANGRVGKYPECGFTCNTSRGSSMVDYVIVDSTLLVQIDNFHICEQTPISDHSGITALFKYNETVMNTEISEIAPTRYIWNEDNKVKYIENICSEECTIKIELLIEKLGEVQESERLEEVVNDVQCIILDAAKPCKKRPTNENANRHTVKCSKWYDGEGAEQRKLYVVSRNVYNRNRTDDAKANRDDMRSKYVKMCKQKARENERLETKEWNDNRFKNPQKY